MPNGELPLGLLADDLPQNLMDIQFCVTNLRTLPDDFDLKWPQIASIYFEASNFTEVPPSLARLSPQDLSLALNPISQIPAALFEGYGSYLHVGGTLISELPQNVKDVSPYLKVRLENTNISFFWDWIDPLAANIGLWPSAVPTILATGTPYCKELQQLYDGQISSFSEPWHENMSILLLNASSTNWDTLQKAVSCEEWPSTWYPLDKEDAYSQIR
ncbi:hypothetical protein P3T76_005734 [Phytophthora citrophthora]|uniref:Uncharacterized protein n=1 Tax=Phytophthora citrophthora TaxID=4793 RepID=A0AAD9GQT1_9STRA|nr:hypothetical protein P3T76_005734 [Phytophthora citrophthora]